jgi:hypothetical protein
MDVINDTKELYYIDDGTPMDTHGKNPSVSVHDEAGTNLPKEKGQGVDSKASDPIELGSTDIEKLEENLSRSTPLTFDEAERNAEGFTEGENAFGFKGNDTLLFETTGISPPNTLFFWQNSYLWRLIVFMFFQWQSLWLQWVLKTKARARSRATCARLD